MQNYFKDCLLLLTAENILNPKVTLQELEFAKTITSLKRKKFFLLGRHHAHLLLQNFNQPLQTLEAKNNGAINWQKGIKGSISHSEEQTAICVSNSKDILSIGIDLEYKNRKPSANVYQKIKHQKEKFISLTPLEILKIFCAKEAIIKCLGQLERKILFQDICIVNLSPCIFSVFEENIFFTRCYIEEKENYLLAAFILKNNK